MQLACQSTSFECSDFLRIFDRKLTFYTNIGSKKTVPSTNLPTYFWYVPAAAAAASNKWDIDISNNNNNRNNNNYLIGFIVVIVVVVVMVVIVVVVVVIVVVIVVVVVVLRHKKQLLFPSLSLSLSFYSSYFRDDTINAFSTLHRSSDPSFTEMLNDQNL